MNYFERPEESRSSLMDFRVSPERYEWKKNNKTKVTEAMSLGRFYHSFILEPQKIIDEYWFLTDQLKSDLLKSFKEAGSTATSFTMNNKLFKKYAEENPLTFISDKDYNLTVKMADKFKSSPYYSLLSGGIEVEKEIYTQYYGLDCKAKIDAISNDAIIDIKTIADISKAEREMYSDNYLFQASFYRSLYFEEYLEKKDVIYIFQEKEAPYTVRAFKLTYDLLEYGDKLVNDTIEDFKAYKQNGLKHEIKELEIKPWQAKQLEYKRPF